MKFELTLNFEPDDLRHISDANQKVALAKPTLGGSVEVLWLAFDPFESNTVTWTEDYWIYASTTSVARPGTVLTKLSEVQPGPAVTGSVYTFEDSATFSDPTPDKSVAAGTFAALNNMGYAKQPYLTFGLSQSAQVNEVPEDRRPISATSVLATQSIQMTPFTEVYIWLEGRFTSSTIITTVEGSKSSAKFGGGVDSIALVYDPKSGKFHQ